MKLSGYDYDMGWVLPLTVKRVWQNSDPLSAFDSQMVEVDLSEYNAICVVTRQNTTDDRRAWNFGFIGDTFVTVNKNAANATLYGRLIESTPSSIVFGAAYAGSTAGTSNAIPIEVYGIKGIIV